MKQQKQWPIVDANRKARAIKKEVAEFVHAKEEEVANTLQHEEESIVIDKENEHD